MSTEIVHGPRPAFTGPLARGRYGVRIIGRYTKTPGRGAAGVTHVRWHSRRPVKRRAELLTLRTAFIGWFMEAWTSHGGTWASGARAFTDYGFRRIQRRRRAERSR